MKKLLIIKTGAALPNTAAEHGDFEVMFQQGLGIPANTIDTWLPDQDDTLPETKNYCGIVITGSRRMVTDGDSWIEKVGRWLVDAAIDTPILGVCYGHQLIGKAFGGHCGWNPNGPEIGTVTTRCIAAAQQEDPLFKHLPTSFSVNASHQQSVLYLPENAVILAANEHDPHHAMRIGEHVWGLQFHPEFNGAVIRDYINKQQDVLQGSGQNPQQLLEQTTDTPDSRALLRRFAVFCGFS